MTAGLNLLLNIHRYSYQADDEVGGAVITGTVQYYNVMGRISPDRPTTAFLEQGLETLKTYTGIVIPGTLDIRNRDEVEVVAPFDHWDYGKFFRVMGDPEHASPNPRDPRNFMQLRLARSDRAHARQ